MKIGFDIDGVLADINVATLRIMDNLKKEAKNSAEQWYYRERKPLLDPRMMLGKDDEMVFITGRPERVRKITEDWVKFYYPQATLHFASPKMGTIKGNTPEEIAKWCASKLLTKATKINELGIDVFFEDDSEGLCELRDACPNCKIIKYGGRI
jgi:hypothetical protein